MSNDLTVAQCQPTEHYTGTLKGVSQYCTYGQDYWRRIDALHHYFESADEDPCDPGVTEEADDSYQSKMTQGNAIANLALGFYEPEKPIREVFLDNELQWQEIRNNAYFIAGGFTQDSMKSIVNNLKTLQRRNLIVIDADGYDGDRTKGEPVPAFTQLMSIAHRTKEIIDEGLLLRYFKTPRKLMEFLNADGCAVAPFEDFPDDNAFAYDSDHQFPSKWLVEGKLLANELVKIKEFQDNFNTLVILNAHRYITSDQLNLTKLYRLFAKLGRINTRIVFVG